jgi:hypothetical protein
MKGESTDDPDDALLEAATRVLFLWRLRQSRYALAYLGDWSDAMDDLDRAIRRLVGEAVGVPNHDD